MKDVLYEEVIKRVVDIEQIHKTTKIKYVPKFVGETRLNKTRELDVLQSESTKDASIVQKENAKTDLRARLSKSPMNLSARRT